MYGEGDWLISTEWIILSILLFNYWLFYYENPPMLRSFFCEWQNKTQNICGLCLFREVYPYTSFLNFLVTNFLAMFLPSPSSSSQTIDYNPWISIRLHVLPFLLPGKVSNWVYCLKFYPRKISFDLCPSGTFQKAIALCFGVIPANCAEPSVNQAQVFFLCQLIIGNSPMRT